MSLQHNRVFDKYQHRYDKLSIITPQHVFETETKVFLMLLRKIQRLFNDRNAEL